MKPSKPSAPAKPQGKPSAAKPAAATGSKPASPKK